MDVTNDSFMDGAAEPGDASHAEPSVVGLSVRSHPREYLHCRANVCSVPTSCWTFLYIS